MALGFSATAQYVTIPDENFKAFLLANKSINTDSDTTTISIAEAEAYTGDIVFNYMSVSSIAGIEAFVNIASVAGTGNDLTTVDLSHNTKLKSIYFKYNTIMALNISNNTELTDIEINYNNLTSLDVSNNLALVNMACNFNPNLSSICIASTQVATSSTWLKDANATFDACHETGIDDTHSITTAKIVSSHNLQGQEVGINYKGLVIITFFDGSRIKLMQ